MSDVTAFLPFAHALADAAGEVLRRYYRTPFDVEQKADATPVTIADREAEAVMREHIRARYPEHGIVGEEHGREGADAELVWCLDPIDGTKSFVTGRPLFGTLVGLFHNGLPVLGIIDQCILRERWVGCQGQPTTHNGAPVRVRSCGSLDQAILFASSPRMFPTEPELAAYERVERQVRFPMYSTDCIAYGLLATGFADLVVEADMASHDFAALVPVVQGAGGVMSDWQGAPLTIDSPGQTLAAGDHRMYEAALGLLNLNQV